MRMGGMWYPYSTVEHARRYWESRIKPTLHSSSNDVIAGICGVVFLATALIVLAGCTSTRRQRDYARLYTVVPGEEREDFGRLASWIAEHDGQITLPIGGTVYWSETAYYRWYSNETFVITTCPPRFHETRSEIRWLCGYVSPAKRGVGWAMTADYGLRGPGTYDFFEARMYPENAPLDGVFGVRFGDRRPRLLQVLEWHISDQLEGNRRGARKLASNDSYDLFSIGYLRGYPGTQLSAFLSASREVGILKVRMPNSPGLSGLDFMKEDPPVLRQGSFIVDAELVAKGKRRPVNMVPKSLLPKRHKP